MRIIYHHPGEITENGKSGSQVRPFKMLQAFKNLGISVTQVTGSFHERRTAINKIKNDLIKGVKFDFVYSENRTIPFAMTEHHRLPIHPFLDHLFLNLCSRNGIPVAMFYRDIFWKDESYQKMLPLWGRLITIPLYWFDWIWHTRYVHTMYIPSRSMEHALPQLRGTMRLKALPPGSDDHLLFSHKNSSSKHGQLSVLYVGGIEPPTYDLRPLLSTISNSPSSTLTICCRESEWEKFSRIYQPLLNERMSIVHASGSELAPLYSNADVQAFVRTPTSYLDFSVPVKLFESISYETPLIATPGTEAARIIDRHKAGWLCELEDMPELLEDLSRHPERIIAKQLHLKMEKKYHTWEARANQVCNDFSTKKTTSTPDQAF